MTAIDLKRSGGAALLLVTTAVVTPRSAVAQEPTRDPIAAEALFERGKALVDQGNLAEACAAFAESQHLDPAGGTLLRLALCHEAEGKLASAWFEYLEVVRISRGPGDAAKLEDRVHIARQHLAAIEPRVPKLVIVVPTEARTDGLRVSANGLPRNEGTWGVPLPVDPGDVVVAATAPGRLELRSTVHVEAGKQETVRLTPLTLATPGPDSPPAVVSPPRATTRPSVLRPVGFGVGAAGIVALGVGTYFGITAISKWNSSNDVCPGTVCRTQAGVTDASDAKSAALAADVTIATGLVAAGAGVVLLVLAPSSAHVQASGGGVAVSF